MHWKKDTPKSSILNTCCFWRERERERKDITMCCQWTLPSGQCFLCILVFLSSCIELPQCIHCHCHMQAVCHYLFLFLSIYHFPLFISLLVCHNFSRSPFGVTEAHPTDISMEFSSAILLLIYYFTRLLIPIWIRISLFVYEPSTLSVVCLSHMLVFQFMYSSGHMKLQHPILHLGAVILYALGYTDWRRKRCGLVERKGIKVGKG